MSTTLNASTSSGLVQSADTSGTLELQSNGTTQLTVASTGAYGTLKSGTAVASTSGTSIDFTSIPSWAKRITVMFQGVSLNSTASLLIQLGTGNTVFTTSGYLSTGVAAVAGGNSLVSSTSGFIEYLTSAAGVWSGQMVITNINGNNWVSSHVGKYSTGAICSGAGDVSLGAVLTAVRITTSSGTDTFDAGTINIIYEG